MQLMELTHWSYYTVNLEQFPASPSQQSKFLALMEQKQDSW